MMSTLTSKWPVLGGICLAMLLFASPAAASNSMGTPAGVGNDPPSGPFRWSPDNMIMVGGEEDPVPITIDPNADPWIKTFEIPDDVTLDKGATFSVWESLLILPQSPTSGIPPLPLTDWHEHIHQVSFDTPIGWTAANSRLTIHNPDPSKPPLVDVEGMVDPADDSGIWFGPFPPVPIPPNGLPVWIHKDLVYTGDGPLTPEPGAPILITVWEQPTVPEPCTAVLAGLGGLALIGLRRRSWLA